MSANQNRAQSSVSTAQQFNARLDHVEGVNKRIEGLLQREIDFISNPEFKQRGLEDANKEYQSILEGESNSSTPTELPAHLRRMCDTTLLTQEQEQILFREMNYQKFCANFLRTQLNPTNSDLEAVAAIEGHLHQAQLIREHLLKANMRLVMSIVKKFVTSQHSFDDLLSEGTFILMQAVEKFDYSRGFRFSTYAYRSIVRGVYRLISVAHKEEEKVTLVAEDWPFETAPGDTTSSMADQVWSNLSELTAEMVDKLDRRERLIIRSRYALGAHRKVTTFQALADKLGVSKERVRQLEQRAVGKLQAMASEFEQDDLFAAAML